jgi:type III secretory pathway component EscV
MELLGLIGGASAIVTICVVIGVLIVRAVDAFIGVVAAKALIERLVDTYEDIIDKVKDWIDD